MSTQEHATIYEIVNLVTLRRYIGHTQKIPRQRFYGHRRQLNQGKHSSPDLQADWNEYGEAMFIFQVIEECDQFHKLEREQHHINLNLDRLYNATKLVRKPRLGCKQPPHEVERVRQFMLGNQYGRGKHPSAEQREAQSVRQTGKKHSPEWSAAISAGQLGKPKPKLRGKKRPQDVVERAADGVRRAISEGKVRQNYRHSEETKRKMSESQLGRIGGPMSGRRHSPETIAKMIAAQTGKPRQKHSDETKAKMSAKRRGVKQGPRSEEAKENMRQAQLRYHAARRAKIDEMASIE